MNISNDEKCSICLGNITNNVYTIPECDHKFHINCIMTWFRLGHKCCPLCRHNGINNANNSSNFSLTHISNELSQFSWIYRKKLLNDDYKKMRIFSRKKDAPKHLKKKVAKLKRMEQKMKNISKEIRDFRNSKQPELTVSQVITKIRRIKGRHWKLKRNIKNLKQFIGLTNPEIQIIIPVKIEV